MHTPQPNNTPTQQTPQPYNTPTQVATRRTRTAGKVEIPNVDDHVSKLEHMGKETVKKLQDLRGAAGNMGIELEVPENTINKGGLGWVCLHRGGKVLGVGKCGLYRLKECSCTHTHACEPLHQLTNPPVLPTPHWSTCWSTTPHPCPFSLTHHHSG